jgi:hypothetical protein
LRQVRQAEKQLEQMVNTLVTLEKEEPKRQDWLRRLNEAKGLEAQALIEEALAIYRAILKEGFDEKGLAERVQQLEKAWEPVSDAHRQARSFIYQTWPKLTSPGDLLKNLKEADEALKICINAKDRFGAMRFLTVTVAHGERLAKIYADLKPKLNIGDEEQARQIKEVTEKLDVMAREAQKFLRPPTPQQ